MHDEVQRFIKGWIRRERLKEGDRLPSIRRLAELSGASLVTVHRAVAGLVSEGALVSKVGAGTFLAQPPSLSRAVALMALGAVDALGGDFVADITAGIRETLVASGYEVFRQEGPCLASRHLPEEELKAVRELSVAHPAGAILNLYSPSEAPVWQELAALPFPVLCVNNRAPDDSVSSVTLDNELGGRMAANHFLERGHRVLALIDCGDRTSSVIERQQGFHDALAAAGLSLPPDNQFLYHLADWNTKEADLLARRIIGVSRRPSGIFAANDTLAMRCITAFRNIGLRAPDEISIIGYDDSELCEHTVPRLTSIRQPGRAMGRRAAAMLLERLRDPEAGGEVEVIRFAPRLVVRDSVAVTR